MIKKRKIENSIFYLGLFLFLLGGIGFFRGFYVSVKTTFPEKTFKRVPLGDLNGVAVDSWGKIYCVSSFYSRVQVYGQNGGFIYGLKIPANSFCIYFDEEHNLNVQTRSNALYIFDSNGNLIKQNKKEYGWFDLDSNLVFVDNSGNRFKVRNRLIFPHIIKITPDGKEKTIVSNSLLEWLIAGPFPAWMFFALGFILVFIYLGVPSEISDAHRRRMESKRTKKPIIEV